MQTARQFSRGMGLLAGIGVLIVPIIAQGYSRQRPVASEPKVEHRAAVRYVAIRTASPISELPSVEPKLWKAVFGWLGKHHVAPSGAPLIRYLVIDMPNRIEIEVGVPVAKTVKGNGRILSGVLPAGQYVVLTHVGPYDGMVQANADLQAWAEKRGIHWQMHTTKLGSAWAGRTEFYLKDPSNEKDPEKYETEIAYLTVDGKAKRRQR
jgi:effector-binding domain-containing protein